MKFKVGQKVYDNPKRCQCIIEKIETHDKLKVPFYQVKQINGIFTRNCFEKELKPIKTKKKKRKVLGTGYLLFNSNEGIYNSVSLNESPTGSSKVIPIKVDTKLGSKWTKVKLIAEY